MSRQLSGQPSGVCDEAPAQWPGSLERRSDLAGHAGDASVWALGARPVVVGISNYVQIMSDHLFWKSTSWQQFRHVTVPMMTPVIF